MEGNGWGVRSATSFAEKLFGSRTREMAAQYGWNIITKVARIVVEIEARYRGGVHERGVERDDERVGEEATDDDPGHRGSEQRRNDLVGKDAPSVNIEPAAVAFEAIRT